MKGQLLRSSFLKFSILLFFINIGYAQTTITIVNSDGLELVGVDVFSEDFQFTSKSDLNGQVSIPKLDANPNIHFKYLGFEELIIRFANITEDRITLSELEEIIEEIIVVGRTDARQEDLPYALDYIRAEDVALTNSQTTADALQANAAVFVQKSQMGGGSPVIRGFEANRVLLVVDGVRMNNAIYRNGHLQNAITVDNAILKQTEVIYGPGSLIYGSDALGGVVHFRTINPSLNFDADKPMNFFGNGSVRYSTANSEKTFHVDANLGFEKFGSLTSFSYSDFGDLRMGASRTDQYPNYGKRPSYAETSSDSDILVENEDPNIQVGTAYQQYDLLQKFLYQPNERLQFIANIQYSTSSDIPRYDALIEEDGAGLNFAEWYYGPQNRFLSSLTTKIQLDNAIADELIIIPSYQFIEEDRINRKFGDAFREHNEEDVTIYMTTLDFKKEISPLTNIIYGLDWSHNKVSSTAYAEDRFSGQTNNNILTRYPGGDLSMSSIGAFGHLQVQNPDSTIRIFAGLRFNTTTSNIQFEENEIVDWPADFISGLENKNQSLTWSLGANFFPAKNTIIRAIGSTAFRSPNIDDLAKIRVKSDEISFPNLNLAPEKSLNFELGITQRADLGGKNNLSVNLTGFYTNIKDAIVRETFTDPQGNGTFVNRGDTLAIVANVNAQEAYIAGISTNIEYRFLSDWTLKSGYNYIKGRVKEVGDDTPLAHIPPIYGSTSLNFAKNDLEVSIAVRYNGKKPIEEYGGSADNEEFATPEGALAWTTYNLYTSYNIHPKWTVNIAAENLLDKHYRPFASGLNAAGRNFIISLRGKL